MWKTAYLVIASIVTLPSFAGDDLEPCINGGVSASGLFASQSMEQLVLRSRSDKQTVSQSLPALIVPNDDPDTCWVAPEWRDGRS